jgi:hypothetical protein
MTGRPANPQLRLEERLRRTRCRVEASRCRVLLLLHVRESVRSVVVIAGCACERMQCA